MITVQYYVYKIAERSILKKNQFYEILFSSSHPTVMGNLVTIV